LAILLTGLVLILAEGGDLPLLCARLKRLITAYMDYTNFLLKFTCGSLTKIDPRISWFQGATELSSRILYNTGPILPSGQNRQRRVFLTICHCILSAELTKSCSFRLFFLVILPPGCYQKWNFFV